MSKPSPGILIMKQQHEYKKLYDSYKDLRIWSEAAKKEITDLHKIIQDSMIERERIYDETILK